MAKQQSIYPSMRLLRWFGDRNFADSTWVRGIVRDRPHHQIPAGGLYDATDFLVEKPGMVYKRGGWERHSAQLLDGDSAPLDSVSAVATLHIPTRVVAVGGDSLYDVTSEVTPQADLIGACPSPGENPPQYVDRLIFCFSDASAAPKKVYFDSGGSTIAVDDLGGSPPAAAHSIVYASRIVLGRGDNTDANHPLTRMWFSPLPDVESTWDTANAYLDTSGEITGFAPIQGVLLVFHPTSFERILGGIPPGTTGEDMRLQPASGGVGCLDARSIAYMDGEVIFAGEEGVWATNGGSPRSLVRKNDGTGIQTFWTSLFPPHEERQIIGGIMERDFYLVSILDSENGLVETLLCYLPTESWTRITNTGLRMVATGRTEQETLELYGAASNEGYVHRLTSILRPGSDFEHDGDGTDVEPTFIMRGQGMEVGMGEKHFTTGHVTYKLGETATITVSQAVGLEADGDFQEVKTLQNTGVLS